MLNAVSINGASGSQALARARLPESSIRQAMESHVGDGHELHLAPGHARIHLVDQRLESRYALLVDVIGHAPQRASTRAADGTRICRSIPCVGDADDEGAAAWLDAHQSLALKLCDGFANGQAADAEALRQGRLLEMDAWLKISQHDGPAHACATRCHSASDGAISILRSFIMCSHLPEGPAM